MTTIKDLAAELGISAHAIRFYEKEGMVEIPRNHRGIRQFDERSIDRLKAIVHYRRVGMSLDDIRQILSEFHNHNLSTKLLEKTRVALEEQIAGLQDTHRYLVKKIAIHKQLAALEAQGMTDEARTAAYYDLRRGESAQSAEETAVTD